MLAGLGTGVPIWSDRTLEYGYIKSVKEGWNLRSLLEARFVCLLDQVGLEWEYEPCYVELPGGVMYLPDFWLPSLGCIVEVKAPAPASVWKAESLARLVGAGLIGGERVLQARPGGFWQWDCSRWAPSMLVDCVYCGTKDFLFTADNGGKCGCYKE